MFEDIKALHKCLAKHGYDRMDNSGRKNMAGEFVLDLITSTSAWVSNLDTPKAEEFSNDMIRFGFDTKLHHARPDGIMAGTASVQVFLISKKSNSVQFIQAD